ncbi:Uu.00g011300.m01.CDS01 [Anthostomella pinea]|uniref:Uu.00g011300.m01.CDS01 n=1 Tax=Anthostomella pinea TaxID=933095 RepID=A0AAI8YQ71_9PEZI|nr:Uu.00g011300.m01.CDS01 [Anthostomella pinea]
MEQALGLSGLLTIDHSIKLLGHLVLVGLVFFFVRLYQVRIMFRRVRKEHGIPIMPHSFLFGHLWTTAKIAIKHKIPRDGNGHWMFHFIKLEYPEIAAPGVLYMDVWPIGYPMIAVYHPEIMAQFTQEHSLPKWWAQGQREFKHFTGGEDLVHLEGQEWKAARAMFNPGFSAKNLLSLIPNFMEEALVFRERLREAAVSGAVVKLENYTTDVTVDVVARAVLGTRLQTQTMSSKLMKAMQAQLSSIHLSLDLSKSLNPTRPIKNWFYNRTIRAELMSLIQQTVLNYEQLEGPKTVLALALRSYVEEKRHQGASSSGASPIPPEFLERVIKHIKIFMFAGHDTTATTLAYAYHLLSLNSKQAGKMRAEHDEVLGPDPAAAASRIAIDPTLLNSLPYTLAAIKETLRLFPPVGGTIRQSPPGHHLTHPHTRQRYPTHGFMLHSSVTTTARAPEFWPSPDAFMPERFLARDASDPLYPVRNVWRPFEMGPRACIGQELVTLELRLILALTVREFVVEEAYEEGAPVWFGTRAYQVETAEQAATAHVKGGMPVRVRVQG